MKRLATATITAIATFTLIRKGIRKLSAENENQPKFTVGDYVKIHGIPTVYRIDQVEGFDNYHAYHLEGTPDTSLYGEDVLEAIDYETDIDEAGGEYIIPLFDVGDTVQIDGCPEVYKVIGAFPEMIYALQDVATNEIIDMDECVLKTFDGEITENQIVKESVKMAKEPKEERKLTPREESSREAERRKQARKQKAADIDTLLEIAFWNRKQFEATGDEAFAEKEREQYAKIKEIESTTL
jgi:hypothetical protein